MYLIDFVGGAEGDRTPDLRIANETGRYESGATTERVRTKRQLRALNRPFLAVSLLQKPKPFPERAEDPCQFRKVSYIKR